MEGSAAELGSTGSCPVRAKSSDRYESDPDQKTPWNLQVAELVWIQKELAQTGHFRGVGKKGFVLVGLFFGPDPAVKRCQAWGLLSVMVPYPCTSCQQTLGNAALAGISQPGCGLRPLIREPKLRIPAGLRHAQYGAPGQCTFRVWAGACSFSSMKLTQTPGLQHAGVLLSAALHCVVGHLAQLHS